MPYIYDNSPDWREKAANSFTDSFTKSLEAAMLRKFKKKDEAERLAREIAISGLRELPPDAIEDDYDSIIELDGRKLGKPISAFEKQKRQLELDVLKRKGSEPTLEEIISQGIAMQSIVPEGTTIRKGGLTIPLKPAPKETTEQKERAKAGIKAQSELAEMSALTSGALGSLDRALELNKDSYGGKVGAGIFKTKSALNIGTKDPKFTNTAEVINIMKGQVIKDLKKTFGAQLSDAEREYLDSVYGAMEGMSQAERDIAIRNVKKIFESKVLAAESKFQSLTGAQPSQPMQQDNADPVIRTGTDKVTGKKVGMTQSGKIIPLE